MTKPTLTILLMITIVCSFAAAATIQLGIAQTGTQVSGIISQDATWSKANSPYNLTGPVAVNSGVTLTVEAGATVNLNNYYIQVNGTLAAKGTNTEKIHFNSGQITYTSVSNGWNEQTQSGAIIENAILNSTSLSSAVSIKISDSIVNSIFVGHSSIVQNSIVRGIISGSPTLISNNTITGSQITTYYVTVPYTSRYAVNISSQAVISNNNITGRVQASFSTISGNTIAGNVEGDVILNNTITGDVGGGSIVANNIISGDVAATKITNNTITGGITDRDFIGRPRGTLAHAVRGTEVSNNIINSVADEPGYIGVFANEYIYGNLISGFGTGIIISESNDGTLTIEKNLITNNTKGISAQSQATIQNNTINNNDIGIYSPSSLSTIVYNNIQNNNYNVYLIGANDVNATYNWWGTTDVQAINNTVRDFKNDFNLGVVSFTPFLTEPNSQALPNPNITTPPPTVLTTPTPTPSLTPTSIQSNIPNPSTNPSTNPSVSPIQTLPPNPNTPQQELDNLQIALAIAIVAVIVLLIVIFVLVLKRRR